MRYLQSFRYLKAIVEAGSIRGAAENLAISPSALNRHIQTLEYDIDIQIFERLTRGVQLSPEGEIFYNFALNQLLGYKNVRNEINNIRGLNVGSVKLAFSADVNFDALLPQFAAFQYENQNVDVEIHQLDQEQIFDLLKIGNLDLAICINPDLGRGIKVLSGRDSQIQCFVPKGINLGSVPTVKLYELHNIRLATPPRQTETYRRIRGSTERLRVEMRVNYSGPEVSKHLLHTKLPVIGCMMIAELNDGNFSLTGYKRASLDSKDSGSCNMSLLASEERGLSGPAHKLRLMLGAIFE